MCNKVIASKYHEKGFNCAESVIKAYNEEFNTDIPVCLGSGLGSGCGVASLCGAVNASNIIIGYVKGRSHEDESTKAKVYAKDLTTTVRKEYGSELCIDLKKDLVACREIMDFAYDSLKETLKKEL
ncbi:TPA: C-GCAxxG-C-C family protein [Clostridioides difficile]|nr:C-GCAxxG-C-C family protein [Clostridioides difficile]